MDYSEYYRARNQILNIIRDDLIGPVEEDEELIESPISYYLLGKIYPGNILGVDEEEQKVVENENVLTEEDTIALGNENFQSAMGYTFALSSDVESFTINASAASYEYIDDKRVWKRVEHNNSFVISIKELIANKSIDLVLHEHLHVYVKLYKYNSNSDIRITVTLVNRGMAVGYSYKKLSSCTYFQPKLEICNVKNGIFVPVLGAHKYAVDDEMELLYHECEVYATGHGCAISVDEDESVVNSIKLQVMPEAELLQMKPAGIECGKLFCMKYLSEADYSDFINALNKFCGLYEAWIDSQRSMSARLDSRYMQNANSNISKCEITLKLLQKAGEFLENPTVFRAFQLANKSMLLQRMHTTSITDEESVTWYPFQLAFFLQEIESLVDRQCENRNTVDLLWFPTGGGKTEAYLGIAAFSIFYRRLISLEKGVKDFGTSVIMRYTLRLLSLQQFERASSMICAAEVLRKQYNLGETPFGIGLWAGQSLTPNKLIDALDYLTGKSRKVSNPVQIKRCPWCGRQIDEGNYKVNTKLKRMHILCSNSECDFNEGLPIYLIDEEIYEYKPSFIIGTIDKFAQIAFVEKAGGLLGIGAQNPVDLIIQDELHLISGPLGTIDGAYEAAFLKLMERDGIQPKIIASTATIRNADSQIMNLYGKKCRQFPPQGINITDSFFACQTDRDSKASRLYLGLMAPGVSRATTFNRVVASLLFASRYLMDNGFSEEVIDSFWTQTDYFNNLRELGTALTRIVDGVQDRYFYLKKTKFKAKYETSNNEERYNRSYELTSRNSSEDLGEALQNQLQIRYKSDEQTNPYDFLVASNMISVGVDIPRLNSMVVVGQPIKSSEYIQSTSRVGRSTPGLVITIFSPSKSRDRSHYEQFLQYHSALYKYVEATSLTPFSDRARDRTLQAIYIILCRYSIRELRLNEGAAQYRRDIPGLEEIREYIFEYVKRLDPLELDSVKEEINDIELLWEELAIQNSKLVYKDYSDPDNSLFDEDYEEDSRFRMMGSMRDVEPEINVTTWE